MLYLKWHKAKRKPEKVGFAMAVGVCLDCAHG